MSREAQRVVLIRADADAVIGAGHVMRMIALAEAIIRRGGKVVFVSVRCQASLQGRLKSLGIDVEFLDGVEIGVVADALITVEIGQHVGASWIVCDGYSFGYDYQKSIRARGFKLLCFDDHHYSDRWCCDAIVNQNLDAQTNPDYPNDVDDPALCLGSSFCLLREEFINNRPDFRKYDRIENLLITLGGGDHIKAIERILVCLTDYCNRILNIRILLGANKSNIDSLQRIETHHLVQFVDYVENMPDQLNWADGIFSAGGSTCWEWLFYRLPAAVVTVAQNQIPIVDSLTKVRSVALDFGTLLELSELKQRNELMSWLDDPLSLCNQDDASGLVDGRGADRVAAMLLPRLRISLITTGESWMRERINTFIRRLESNGHDVVIVSAPEELVPGDVLFILSYWGLIKPEFLQLHQHNLVVHASRLPEGKGWSPTTWQILEGEKVIPVTLFEAVERVDSGDIYLSAEIELEGHELIDEWRLLLADKTFELCESFVSAYPEVVTWREIQEGTSTFYSRRTPEDSLLDVSKSLEQQFDLLRVVDNERYPAFFEYRGNRYYVRIEKNDK